MLKSLVFSDESVLLTQIWVISGLFNLFNTFSFRYSKISFLVCIKKCLP
jgi:hypothetical protein